MFLPGIAKDTNIVDVDIDFLKVSKERFHDLLRDIGQLFNTHGQTTILVIAKRSTNGTKFAAMFVKDKRVKLHRNVIFCEKGVMSVPFEDIVYPRQGIDLVFYHGVEGAKVANPSQTPIFVGHEECG